MHSRRSTLRIASLLPVLALAAACAGDSSATPTLAAVVDTIAGVERMSYPDRRARALEWSYDTLVVLGGFEVEDPAFQFGSVTRNGLATDSDGNLYVLDADGRRILGFTRTGLALGTWGREGAGPGEFGGGFAGPQTMAMGPGDTLWVGDLANQRMTLIPVRGGSPGSVPLGDQPVGIGGKMVVGASGALAELTSFSFTPGADAGFPPRPLVWIGRDGSPGDTVWTAPAPERDLVTFNQGGNQMMVMLTRRFSPDFLWVRFADGTLAVQDAADYRIELLRPDGSVRRRIERAPAARPVSEADRQKVIDELLEPPEEENTFSTPEVRRQMAESATFSDVVPRVVSLLRDGRDRLWAGVSENEPGEVERIDVYDREGQLLGELPLLDMPTWFLGDDHAVFLDEDDLEVQTLTIVKLVEAGEAAARD